METQKIVIFLNSSENEYSKFATKKWCVIDSESKGVYSHENPSKFLTSSFESGLCDYSYTKGSLKTYAPYRKCRKEIN